MKSGRALSWRTALVLCGLAVLAGCAQPPAAVPVPPVVAGAQSAAMPLLQLAPAALGRTLALQQQLSVRGPDGTERHLQALLEADASEVRIALTAMGQVLARMRWDGAQLDVQRSRHWPQQVEPERILSDLQLVLWPTEVIAQALPPLWRLLAQPDGSRRLLQGETARVEVRVVTPDLTEINYLQEGWRLRIVTAPLSPTGPKAP